jgi:hypothetical protein
VGGVFVARLPKGGNRMSDYQILDLIIKVVAVVVAILKHTDNKKK